MQVRLLLPRLFLRGRLTGRTLGFDPGNFGSNPNSAANVYGGVAQLAEQMIDSRPVASSNLAATTSKGSDE